MPKKNVLKKLLGDIKVVEAKADLMLTIRPEDIKGAKQHNAVSCALARCVHRTISDKAIFLSKIAYIYAPDQDGEWRWVRYTLPAATQQLIWMFDHRGPAGITSQNATFTLRAVTPGRTLLAQRNAVKECKLRQVGKKIKPVTPRQPFRGRRATLQHIPMLAA